MGTKRRSEYAGISSVTGVPLNPMHPGGTKLKAWERIQLLNLTGYESTVAPFNNRAWHGGPPVGPVPIPSRIPPE